MGDGSTNGDGNNGEGSGNSGISDSSIGGTSPSANESDNGGTSVGLADFSAAVAAAVAGLGGFDFSLSPSFGAANVSSATPASLSFNENSVAAFDGPTGALATVGLENAAVADAPASGLSLGNFAKGVAQGFLGLLGIASGTPQGVIGGGLGLSNAAATLGISGGISGSPVSSVAGDNGASVSFGDGGTSGDFLSATSAPAKSVSGGGIGGAQVLGFNGEPVATTSGATASNGVLSGLSSLLAGRSRPNTAQYASNPSPAPNPALLLAVGVGAFFLFT